MMNIKKFIKDKKAEGAANTIVMFLVIVMIFGALFGTIAYQLGSTGTGLGNNASVKAIPGGTALLGVVAILGIVVIVMWAVKKAF